MLERDVSWWRTGNDRDTGVRDEVATRSWSRVLSNRSVEGLEKGVVFCDLGFQLGAVRFELLVEIIE